MSESVIGRLRREGVGAPRVVKLHINLFGLSGGKDSSALLLWALFKSGYPHESLHFTFTDTGNEHEHTYEHLRLLDGILRREVGQTLEWIKPPRDFYELAFHKHRFPSTKARFCTEHLKIIPMQKWCQARLGQGFTILSHSGVRAGESTDRAALPERDLNGYLLVEEFRPLLRWNLRDVYAIHKEFGVPLNALYAAGAKRVGCFPCIMSRKAEVRNIALNFPERIERIAAEEWRFFETYGRYSSFFPSKTVPARFRKTEFVDSSGKKLMVASIANVVEWSMSGDRARGRFDDPTLFEILNDGPVCTAGFCE